MEKFTTGTMVMKVVKANVVGLLTREDIYNIATNCQRTINENLDAAAALYPTEKEIQALINCNNFRRS